MFGISFSCRFSEGGGGETITPILQCWFQDLVVVIFLYSEKFGDRIPAIFKFLNDRSLAFL